MNFLILISCFLMSMDTANAQVNLDKPLSAGRADKLFASTVDPNVAYYFPVALIRDGQPVLTDRDSSSSLAKFNAVFSSQDLLRATAALEEAGNPKMKIKLFRPLSYEVLPGVDIPPSLNPQVNILNDFGFDGTTQFSVKINSWKRLFHRLSEGLSFFNYFFGQNRGDNIAIIRYEMNAQALGVPVRMKTAVGVFVGTRTDEMLVDEGDDSKLQILDDSKSSCWEQVRVGQFCFKKN